MAYKNEYEVARLILDETFDAAVRHEFGPDATYRVRLHPPVTRSLGLERKISLGRAWRPVFRLLYALRRIRGTRLDVFGHHRVRRAERALVDEYRRTIEDLLPRLTAGNAGTVVEIAALPGLIRGYQDVKLASVDRYHGALAQLHDTFGEHESVEVNAKG